MLAAELLLFSGVGTGCFFLLCYAGVCACWVYAPLIGARRGRLLWIAGSLCAVPLVAAWLGAVVWSVMVIVRE